MSFRWIAVLTALKSVLAVVGTIAIRNYLLAGNEKKLPMPPRLAAGTADPIPVN
jgi:hypothetical protein